ncbi:uncharacterized protein M421DRAFT_90128 [Didymella exigua CBS 183.55]|uniref:Uncharacterized protein n=1 Tax=Didymella exigua CBS 183.55 TaxID=1150837 RepID=A0A6A5RY26_9PLEO|nr:uncharacterized protein M421DRAFT_90128 [Didymella exigua CBS 183.55]KAF1931928.1 hypothetical protein M421DRAFT_90128 [Didymella exigua CBS 183.55]
MPHQLWTDTISRVWRSSSQRVGVPQAPGNLSEQDDIPQSKRDAARLRVEGRLSEDNKLIAKRGRPALSAFTGKERVCRRDRREGVETSSSHMPMGAPDGLNTFTGRSYSQSALRKGNEISKDGMMSWTSSTKRYTAGAGRERSKRSFGSHNKNRGRLKVRLGIQIAKTSRRRKTGPVQSHPCSPQQQAAQYRFVQLGNRDYIADPRPELQIQRNVSLSSCESGFTNELEVRQMSIFMLEQGPSGDVPYSVVAENSDEETADMSREMIGPSWLVRMAQPPRRRKSVGRTDLTLRMSAAEEEPLDEHFSEDIGASSRAMTKTSPSFSGDRVPMIQEVLG